MCIYCRVIINLPTVRNVLKCDQDCNMRREWWASSMNKEMIIGK